MMVPAMAVKILIVDDEEAIREVLAMRLTKWGYQVESAADAGEAEEAIRRFQPAIVISDVKMPEISGLELLRKLKEGDAARPVILVTAHGTVDMAVEAMKEGAHDFITKPIDYDKLRAVLSAAEGENRLRESAGRLSDSARKEGGFGPFVGLSEEMRKIYGLIEDLADTDASVLISGESGTGKELVARSLHDFSSRKAANFVAVNTAAIPSELMESEIFGHEKGAFTGANAPREGCFEVADGGTLFLDEIGEMPQALQTKLLRVLEDGRVRRLGGKEEFQVDVRVLAATNREPGEAVEEGAIRADLYYRLNVFNIHIPPLRQRRDDIPLLAQHFIEFFNAKHRASVEGLRDDTREILASYHWPGNVRELRNVIERAVVLAKGKWIEISHLPPYLEDSGISAAGGRLTIPVGATAREVEKRLILETLQATGGNKAEAARSLGLDVKTIRNKLKSYENEE
jgi:DNA-binding NtrC family response regulator